MKKMLAIGLMTILWVLPAATGFSAYHHEGEEDAAKFLAAYPSKAGTKLDHCALCHSGGSYENSKGKTVELGSCQWCHERYGYDGSGNIVETLNQFGKDFFSAGYNEAAILTICGPESEMDSDGDTHSNYDEVVAGTFPGDATDYPGLTPAPARVYTRAQLEALPQHTQFMLMNTSRSGDFYAQYTGVPMRDLLDDAGITAEATGVMVIAPDGWSQYHPLNHDSDPELYHVYGNMPNETYQYPPASYAYVQEADEAENPTDGWCDYSAPSCSGRNNGDAIPVEGGLKAILAIKREGAYMDPGVLNDENKLDGEGPFRVVVPQKAPNPPDQSSKAGNQGVTWPYEESWDHNAGACSRSATIIRVEPLPEGTTDINILEAGWSYVDQNKIVVYGAIAEGVDSNGNGVPDSEEKADDESDYDSDGTLDYLDSDTARFRHQKGDGHVLMHTSFGDFANVDCISEEDASLSQEGKPAMEFPYGAIRFHVTGLNPGDTVTVSLVFPYDVPTDAKYYKKGLSISLA